LQDDIAKESLIPQTNPDITENELSSITVADSNVDVAHLKFKASTPRFTLFTHFLSPLHQFWSTLFTHFHRLFISLLTNSKHSLEDLRVHLAQALWTQWHQAKREYFLVKSIYCSNNFTLLALQMRISLFSPKVSHFSPPPSPSLDCAFTFNYILFLQLRKWDSVHQRSWQKIPRTFR
jgi:hypothetical protein